jgi:glycosyltransferase involved in cell wall biosynthesis
MTREVDVSPAGVLASGVTVSVVVPHFHDLRNLDLCLAALERQTFPRADFDIIVADNNSPEGEAAVAGVIAGRARLVVVGQRGAGPARNGGVKACSGALLAFVDSDCRPEPAWLAEGVEALSRHDYVGGRMVVLVDDPRHMTDVEAFESVFAFNNQDYVTRLGYTVTANLFCPRTLFCHVGDFTADSVSEDREWCLRARDLGYRIGYAPLSIVGHPARRTWADLLKKWRRINRESFGLMAREKGGRLKWALRTFALPGSAFLHTPRALFCDRLATFEQRAGAIVILHRLRWWRLVDSLRLLIVERTGRTLATADET